MEAYKIIQSSQNIGCGLSAEGENIRVENINRLSGLLRQYIKENKQQLIRCLIMDEKARKKGFVVGIQGTLYTKTFSRNSAVYIERVRSQWQAWREVYQEGRNTALRVKVIATGSTFEYVLNKAANYFDFIEKKRKKEKNKY